MNTIKRKAFDLITTCKSGKVFKNVGILLDPNPKSKLRIMNKRYRKSETDDEYQEEDN